jgi:four helix bundle protein
MTKIEKFEDIIIWQKSRILVGDIYLSCRLLRDYSFKDQVQRAVISIMNNIAEGYERKGNKEFTKFLYIAKGSCGEVRSMLYLALDLKYIKKKEFDNFYAKSIEISKMISGLIKTLS